MFLNARATTSEDLRHIKEDSGTVKGKTESKFFGPRNCGRYSSGRWQTGHSICREKLECPRRRGSDGV